MTLNDILIPKDINNLSTQIVIELALRKLKANI